MFGAGKTFVCMACGTDLWDVGQQVRAGAVTICGSCVTALAEAVGADPESNVIDVVVPPRVQGPVPDADAVEAVGRAFLDAFGDDSVRRRGALEDADEVGPALDQARVQFAGHLDPRLRVERVRFPSADEAEVRFSILLQLQADGMRHEGRAVRRDGRWLVTRSTAASVLPGGGMGLHRTALIATSTPPTEIAPDPPDDTDDD
jgi:hypothetical protein